LIELFISEMLIGTEPMEPTN